MGYRQVLLLVLSFFLYCLLQITLFKNLVIFDEAFCFLYIGFILFLPVDTTRLALILMAFIQGLLIDVFYNSFGIHASALVLMAFLRPTWLNVLTPQGGYESGVTPGLASFGTVRFASYAGGLVLVHHIAIFYVEAGSLSSFFFTLVKVFSSSIFTFIALFIAQLLFYRRRSE